jgi:predicted PurR-regulated permease PerM
MTAQAAGRRAAQLLVVVLALVFLYGSLPIVAGLAAAPALAAVTRPIDRSLARHVGHSGAALIVVFALWIGLVFPGAWLSTIVVHQVPAALSELHRHADALHVVPSPFGNVNVDSLIAHVGATSAGWIASAVGPAIGAVGHGVVNLSIALLGLFFLLATDDAAWNAVRRRLPFSPDGADELRHVFTSAARATLLGTLSSAALQGTSIGIGLAIIGNSAPAFWGVVGAFSTLIPVVGNAVVWVPAVVAPLVRQDYRAAAIMLVCGKLVPALLDRVVRSGISRRLGNVHPMVTLLGVLCGVRVFGVAGLIVGPALIQTGISLLQLYEREYGLSWAPSDEGARPGT